MNTPEQLAQCLDGLRRRRGLSYESMERAARDLPRRPDGRSWDSLGKSTVGEIVTGKRLPARGKLLSFLAVCHIAGADLAQWLAAWERAGTAGLVAHGENQGPARVPAESRQGLNEYLRRVQDYYQQLNLEMLLAMTNVEERLRVPLHRVFTPPLVRADPPAVELPREFRRRLLLGEEADRRGMPRDLEAEVLGQARSAYRQPSRPVLGVVAAPDHRHLVLLGDPGSGKSTIARYLVLRLAELHGEGRAGGRGPSPDPMSAMAGTLPLLIELRLYAATEHTSFVQFLDHLQRTQGLGLPEALLSSYLEGGLPVVVVFDGLDEVFDRDRRNSVCREIREFSRRHPNARVIVTSRPVGYHRQTLDDAGFLLYQLQDLEVGQIASFVAAWYDIACADDPGEAERLTARMVSAARSSPAVHELAGNPLLLTLLCIMGRRRELPRDRVHVYEFAVSLLVEHWDVEAHSFPNQEGLLYEDKLDLLRILARTMLTGTASIAGNRITEQDLQEAFEAYVEDERGYHKPVARTAAHSMIEQLHTRNYILSRFGAGMYGFVHRAFLEYLAALDIVRRFDDRLMDEEALLALFDDHGSDPTWSEVLLLVIRLKERFAPSIIERLLAADQAWRFDGTHVPIRSLLCVRALHEVRLGVRLKTQVQAVLVRIFELLLMLDTNPDGILQAALQDAVLPTFDALGPRWLGAPLFRTWYANAGQELSGPVVKLAARMNAPLGGADELAREAYADHDPLVREAATSVLANQDKGDDAAFARLVRRAESDPAGPVRRCCVSAVVARRRTDPDVLELLRRAVQTDPDPVVRRECVERLDDLWASWPTARDHLLGSAITDPDAGVRAAAVGALVDRFGTDEAVDAVVRERLRDDPDPLVRRAAANGLAAVRPGVPGPEALLSERAVVDVHWAVRQAAVRGLSALAAGGAGVPEVLARLAVSDREAGVRQAALEGIVHVRPGAGATRALLIDRSVRDVHWSVRRTALQSLAGVWSHHPDTLALLVDRAGADVDEDVRTAALLGASSPLVDYSDVYELLRTAYAADPSSSVRRAIVSMLADADHDPGEVRSCLLGWAAQDEDWSVRGHAIETLGRLWPQDPAVRRAVGVCLVEDPDEDVRRAALSCVGQNWLDAPESHALVADRAETDESDVVRIAALGRLAAHWRKDEETLRVLCAHGRDDPDESIRMAALRALAATWPDAPQVCDLVTHVVQHDPDRAVRATCVRLLAQAWPAGAGITGLVVDRAARDRSPGVRRTAAQTLAVAYPGDIEVGAALVDLARDDPSAVVRQAALRAVATGWSGAAETLRLAVTLAGDAHSAVRAAAAGTLARFWPEQPRAVALVTRMAVEDPDPAVRDVAGTAVRFMGT